MRISINGKGMEVSDYLRDVITKRVDKLDKYFRKDTEAKVMLSMLRGRQVVEITVIFGGGLLRSEEATGDVYASLDNACKKLERQIVKHRTRWERHLRDGALKEMEPQFLTADETLAAHEEAQPTIVRTTSIPMKPMMKEEAALQMDMLGHSFFVFEDGETGEINVIYKRKDGNYGLIETSR